MRRDAAEKINALMLECTTKINESIRIVMDTCDEDEFVLYRRTAGRIMGDVFLDILDPIYKEYPDLDPDSDST